MGRTTGVTRTHSIFVPVTALAFNHQQLDDCKQFLEQRSADTEFVTISDPEQLFLAPDGRFAENGYRLNYLGFQSLASNLSRGLPLVFLDLLGQYSSMRELTSAPDIRAAVSVWNTVVRSRMETVRERTLLVNRRERVVEGFLGLNHRMLDNSAFLEIVTSEMQARQSEAQFHRAELVGRELRVFYVDPGTRRKDIYSDPRHTIIGGWSYNNREDQGRSVNAGLCLLTRLGVALERPKNNMRLTHVGADITGRTRIMVAKTAGREVDMPAVLAQIGKLQSVSLGFTDDSEKFEKTMESWVVQLSRRGVYRANAKLIVRNAALVGADIDARDPIDVYTGAVLGSRTAYDLVCSLLRFARSEPPANRDRWQAVAMAMLAPRLRKKKAR
jgi:hypothetical protein